MKNDLISIILPVYNGEKFLSEAIESCLNQTHKNLELIIVNDCSTDGSLEIAEHYAQIDSRIRVVSNLTNKNLPASLNEGHLLANGDFLTWTSDDNFYQKNALEVLYETITKKATDIVYSDYLVINEEGKVVDYTKLKPLEYLIFSGVIGACFLYKKGVYERNKGYKEDLFLVEDYDFWLRALKHSEFYKIDNPGYYYYRYHPSSLTERMKTDSELRKKFLVNLDKVYKDVFLEIPLRNEKLMRGMLVNRFLIGPAGVIEVINQRGVFKDLNKISTNFKSFKGKTLRMFFLTDLIEHILKNRDRQNIKILFKLHREAKWDLLNLPINRYFALVKKCIL